MLDIDLGKVLADFGEAYNEKDPDVREKKLAEFNDPANWKFSQGDMKDLDEMIDRDLKVWCKDHGQSYDNMSVNNKQQHRTSWLKHNLTKQLSCSSHYKMFANILTYSTFRQTSKIGLDFFKEQNTPVLFHMTDRELNDFGDTGWIMNERHWKDGDGHFDTKYGSSEITHSEVRHANKIVQEYGDDANISYVNV